jgi:hypothetical protein
LPYFSQPLSAAAAVIDAFVGVSEPRRAALKQAGQVIPANYPVRALIDTGASCSCVVPSVLLDALHLTPTGICKAHTPSTGPDGTDFNQFDVDIIIPCPASGALFLKQTVAVCQCELLAAESIHVLIGMDILSNCLFSINGASGIFTLAY